MTGALAEAIAGDLAGVLFSEVRGARAKGQAYLRALSAKCLGEYSYPNLNDEAARLALLTPVVDQDERIAFYNRRRGPVPDVSPETGEEVEPDEPPEL